MTFISLMMMMEYNSVYLVLGSLLLILLFALAWHRRRHNNRPPCSSGWIPWLGCAIKFGKAPLFFIEQARQKLGPIFTLHMTGQRFTFLTDPEDFAVYFRSPCIDFQEAVKKPVSKTASISRAAFSEFHTRLHDTVKQRLAQGNLTEFLPTLSSKFEAQLDRHWGDNGSGSLMELIRHSMYVTVLDNLFGEGIIHTQTQGDVKQFVEHFVKYDEQFEYGSELPACLIPEWNRSKTYLLNLLRKSISTMKTKDQQNSKTVLESLLGVVDREHAPNFALLLVWASLANAVPILFWTMAFILSTEEIYRQVSAEVHEVIGSKTTAEASRLTTSDLQRMPTVKRCILETIRLRSVGAIPRLVTKSFTLHGYTIPEGDMLMLSPYWAHRNTAYFPDPEAFKPSRWNDVDMSSNNLFLDGFVAFGGGRFQCPGRWFALMELHIMAAILFRTYNIELLDPVPTNSPLHLVGVQQPVGQLRIAYSRHL